MKPIERLALYFKHNKIKFSEVEKKTGLANGYLGKQVRGLASIGSDILEKICTAYPEIDPAWVLTGKKASAFAEKSNTSIPESMVIKDTEQSPEPSLPENKLLEFYRLQVQSLNMQIEILKEELRLQVEMVNYLSNNSKG